MSTKDGITVWLLYFFVGIPFLRALPEVSNALYMNRPIIDILWSLMKVIIIGASGFFLINHFLHMHEELKYLQRDLEYYRAEAERDKNDSQKNEQTD